MMMVLRLWLCAASAAEHWGRGWIYGTCKCSLVEQRLFAAHRFKDRLLGTFCFGPTNTTWTAPSLLPAVDQEMSGKQPLRHRCIIAHHTHKCSSPEHV